MPGRRTLSGLVVLALLAATALVSYLAYENERDKAMDGDRDLARQVATDARQSVVGFASGRPDLNRGPHRPERCALPSCATPRGGPRLSSAR